MVVVEEEATEAEEVVRMVPESRFMSLLAAFLLMNRLICWKNGAILYVCMCCTVTRKVVRKTDDRLEWMGGWWMGGWMDMWRVRDKKVQVKRK